VDTTKEINIKRNILSSDDLTIDILPSHIHFIISNRITKQDKKINRILFIFSVESYGRGIINQGIIKRVI